MTRKNGKRLVDFKNFFKFFLFATCYCNLQKYSFIKVLEGVQGELFSKSSPCNIYHT